MNENPKQPKVICTEYCKLAYNHQLSKIQGGVWQSGLVTIEYANLSPDAKAAMMASIAYAVDMINEGEI